MALDPRTFIVATSLASLLMMLVFFAQSRSFPESIRGFRTWGLSLAVGAISASLFAARSTIPGVISSALAHMLLVMALVMALWALSLFNNRPLPWRISLACVALVGFSMTGLFGFEQESVLRTIATAAAYGVLFGCCAWMAARDRKDRRLQFGIYFTSGFCAIEMVINFARVVTLFSDNHAFTGLLSVDLMQRIYLGGFSVNILLASVGFVVMGHEKLVENYRELANHDELTGLYNRRKFIEEAERELQKAARYDRNIAVLILEIDNFKVINDTFGHHAGDAVIKDIAAVMRENFREVDLFARYGGEEFIALLPESKLADAAALAERVRVSINQRIVHVGGDKMVYSASFGIAQARPEEQLTHLIARADTALYAAKNAGKNRVELSS